MIQGAATGKAAERYKALYQAREPFRMRARDAASLTMPHLMPPLGFNASRQLPTPYQSLGARGVRNLASKLLMALFSTTTFFRYEIDDFLLEQIAAMAAAAQQAQGAEARPPTRGDFEKAMSRRERAIMAEFNQSLFRVTAFTALLHLIVAGNFALFIPPKGRVRGFTLNQYVVRRDPAGDLLEAVIEEPINIDTLPSEARLAIIKHQIAEIPRRMAAGDGDGDADDHKGTGDKSSFLYTRLYRGTDDKWHVHQECEGALIPGSEGTYPLDECPFMFLRWSSHPSEDYGRSYVEEFLGDLDSLESLSQTLVEGIAATARVLFLVKPNGVTRVKVVATANNGDVQTGNADDVTVVQAANKSADFQTAQKQAEAIATRISYAFMLNSTVQRNAERVTAEEIRYVAGELDDSLGGVYTLFAADWQLPAVLLFEKRMEKNRKVPSLPAGVATPTITTGLEALGRGQDLQAMKAFAADILQLWGPEVAQKYFDVSEFFSRAGASYGIDMEGLVRKREEVEAADQAAQQNALLNSLAPHAVKAAGGLAQTAMAQAGQPEGTQ